MCDDTDLFGDVDVKKCVIADQFATVPDYDGAQKVKINDFVKRYKENQVKADEKYKGKTVQFTAKVTHVADEYAWWSRPMRMCGTGIAMCRSALRIWTI